MSGRQEIAGDVRERVKAAARDVEVKQIYRIGLKHNGETVQPDEPLAIRLLIAENLRGAERLRVYRIDGDGTATDVKALREGDYLVFTVAGLSDFAIVGDKVSLGAIVATGIVWGLALLCGAYLAYYLVKKKKKGGNGPKNSAKTSAWAPLPLAAVVVPGGLAAALVTGIAALVGTVSLIGYLHVKDSARRKSKVAPVAVPADAAIVADFETSTESELAAVAAVAPAGGRENAPGIACDCAESATASEEDLE